MKTFKLILSLTIFLLIIYSCKKNENPVDEPKSMADLIVPENFNWSVENYLKLTVNIIGDGNAQTLELRDIDGNILDKQTILNNKAVFNYRLPTIIDSIRVYSPVNFKSTYITIGQEIIDFHIGTGLKSFHEKAEGFALKFNGETSYVDVDNLGGSAIVTEFPFTLSAWFKTTGPLDEDDDMVLLNIADPEYASVYYGICIRKYTNKYKPVIVARNGGSERVKSFNQNLADDTWHQVVGVFESKNLRKIYVDGIYRGKSTSNVPFNEAAILTNFGRWADKTPSAYFNGLIDNVCVWKKALNEDEVAYYYDNLPLSGGDGLKGFWNFNEGSGNVVYNITPEFYKGLFNNAEWVSLSQVIDSDGDGVPDDEDDWPDDFTKAYLTIYPSGSNYYYHLYEDLWPGLGDYDFNDVVLKSKLYTWKNGQNQLVGGSIKSSVYWIGGGIPRGVGMEWFKSNGSASQLTYLPNETVTFTQPTNVINDPLVLNAVQLFDDNIIESVNDSVDFEYTWDHEIAGNDLWVQVYIYNNERSHEVHMLGHPPTKAADMALFGTEGDASQTTWAWNPGDQFSTPADFYKTSTNLPWGLEIVTSEFKVSLEKIEIINAYPQFQAWAESGGTENQDWYNNPDDSKVFVPESE